MTTTSATDVKTASTTMSPPSSGPVTRETHRLTSNPVDGFTEIESAAISSVELGQDAKGTVYIKSVKSYHADVAAAGKAAVAELVRLKEVLGC